MNLFVYKTVKSEVINPYSPMMDFFYKILLSEKVFNKMNISGFIFANKSNLVQKSQNVFSSV